MRTGEVDLSVVPLEFNRTKLRACLSCSLVKTATQFFRDGCDNCERFAAMKGDEERVEEATTPAFLGVYALMNPKESWVSKYQNVRTFVPGCYAISMDAELPAYLEEVYRENGGRVKQIRATNLA
ncbi:Transcription elongation factor SPT4 [Porphyridium purpureum]|uniref:Transcription elongation factor SPT4 n=1 Tax=Porphyridium purpureum TaxID=35688 RepID=A0A5J4YSZ5_PORPP|nr:Transcription elongation factor SPT4 [Porphyridium purpureum]|eukprot:POR3471..scf236_6